MSPIPFNNFALAAPEIYLLAAICVILIVDLFLPDRARQVTYFASLFALAMTAAIVVNSPAGHEYGFFGMYVRDGVSRLIKLVTCATVAATFLYGRDYLIERGLFRGEFFVLGLLAVLGIFVMVSAGSLLTMYLGIEILALSQYTLVAFDRDSPVAAEAAMKYFVLGAIASGMILYGISMIYGVTGTVALGDLVGGLHADMIHNVGFLLGLSFLIAGIGFKFGAAPFHMWVPDVYHGAPTAVTLFLGAAPKLAYFALAFRVLAEGLGATVEAWRGMIIILALVSIALGSLVGLAQTNIKRLFAYSTIANVGFVLLGIGAGTQDGYRAALFYTITYVLMAIGSFATVILLSKRGFEADRIDDFKGLARSSPWFAWMMLFLMVSTAGVPPFIGFFSKLYVLQAVVGSGQSWVAGIALLFSVVAAFYYLRIVKVMFFDEPEVDAVVQGGPALRLLLSVNAGAVLVLGFFHTSLISAIAQAIR